PSGAPFGGDAGVRPRRSACVSGNASASPVSLPATRSEGLYAPLIRGTVADTGIVPGAPHAAGTPVAGSTLSGANAAPTFVCILSVNVPSAALIGTELPLHG